MNKNEVLINLKKMYPKYTWVYDDFEKLIDQPAIKDLLDKALVETSKRNYINKHGVEHGLTVAYNILFLFNLIEKDIVESDYADLNKEQVLFILLAVGYIHDVGRFYDPDIDHVREVSEAIEIIKDLASPPACTILSKQKGNVVSEIIRRIKELCLCHDKKEEESRKVEIGLIKLVDALDCSQNRVYSEKEKPKELKVDYVTKTRTILSRDKHPEKYFGCLSTDKVEIEWLSKEGVIEITLFIKDYAASVPIRTILKVLSKCESSRESVKRLAKKIRVYIKEIVGKEGNFFMIYPTDPISIPYAEITDSSYNFNILNRAGDTEIENIFEIKNLKDKSGIRSHTLHLGGFKPLKWEIDEIKVKMVDFHNNKEGEEMETLYRYTEMGGMKHVWTVFFKKRIEPGKTGKIKGKYLWKQFFNIEQDEFAYTAHTPCKNLVLDIVFPKSISKEKMKAWIEIEDSENILYKDTERPIVNYNNEARLHLHTTFRDLKPRYTYITKWKVRR